jgi:hypothetical protein
VSLTSSGSGTGFGGKCFGPNQLRADPLLFGSKNSVSTSSVWDPESLNPDPDLGFLVNPGPDQDPDLLGQKYYKFYGSKIGISFLMRKTQFRSYQIPKKNI